MKAAGNDAAKSKMVDQFGSRVIMERGQSLPIRKSGVLALAPKFVGVCGTDLDIVAKFRADRPAVLGHEAVVRVVDSDSVIRYNESFGSSYVINPVNPKNQDSIIGHSENGMLQEAVEIAESRVRAGLLVPVRPALDPLLAVISEPLGAALYGMELLTRVKLPSRMLVIGAGPMGMLTALAARLLGVSDVTVIDRSAHRVHYAIDNGFAHAAFLLSPGSGGRSLQPRPYEDLRPEAVTLCVGREHRLEALSLAIQVAAPGACIDLTTGFAPGDELNEIPGVDLYGLRRLNVCGRPGRGRVERITSNNGKHLYLTGHRGTSQKHILDAMKLLLHHASLFVKIITDVVSLDGAEATIASLVTERSKPDSAPYRKVVVSLDT